MLWSKKHQDSRRGRYKTMGQPQSDTVNVTRRQVRLEKQIAEATNKVLTQKKVVDTEIMKKAENTQLKTHDIEAELEWRMISDVQLKFRELYGENGGFATQSANGKCRFLGRLRMFMELRLVAMETRVDVFRSDSNPMQSRTQPSFV